MTRRQQKLNWFGLMALSSFIISCLPITVAAATDIAPQNAEEQRLEARDAQYLQQLAQLQVHQAQLLEAVATYRQLLEVYRQQGDRNGIATTLIRLVDTYDLLSRHDDALAVLNEALVIYRDLDDQLGEATALDRLGIVQSGLDQPEQALETLQKVLEQRQELGDRAGVAETLMHLGIVQFSQGDIAAAHENLQAALEFHQEVKNGYYTALTLIYLGLSTLQENADQGPQLLEQGLAVAEEIEHRPAVAIAQFALGRIYQEQGQLTQAIASLETALTIAETAGNQIFLTETRDYLAIALIDQGSQYFQEKQYEQAVAVYQRALPIIRQLDDSEKPFLLGNAHFSIGLNHQQLGAALFAENKFEEALSHYQQTFENLDRSIQIFRQNGLIENEIFALSSSWLTHNYAISAYRALENHEKIAAYTQADTYAERALDLIQTDSRTASEIGLVLRGLWNLYAGLHNAYIEIAKATAEDGNTDNALAAYRQALYWNQQAIKLEDVSVSHHLQKDHPITQETRQVTRQGLWNAYLGLANIYEDLKAYDQALEHYNYARDVAQSSNNFNNLETTILSIWGLYSDQGDDYRDQKRYDEAVEAYRAGIQIAQERNSPHEEQLMLASIANLHRHIGKYNQALSVSQEMLYLAQTTDRQRDAFTAWNYIGHIHLDLGNYTDALNAYQKSLAIGQILNNQLNESSALLNLSNVYSALGDYAKALDIAQQSLTLATSATYIPEQFNQDDLPLSSYCLLEDIADYQRELCLEQKQQRASLNRESYESYKESSTGTALHNLASTYHSMGRYPEALIYARQALELKQDNPRADQQITWMLLSVIYSNLGRPEDAATALQQAQTIVESLDDRVSLVTILNNQAVQAQENEDNPEQILAQFDQALALSQELGTRPKDIFILNNQGNVYQTQGEYAKAIETYQAALTLAQELQNARGQVRSLDNLGGLSLILGQTEQALAYRQQALKLVRANGARGYESELLTAAGKVHHYAGRPDQALDYYQQGLNLARELQFPEAELYALGELGRFHIDQKDFSKAERTLQAALGVANIVGSPFLKTSVLKNLGKAQIALGQYEQGQTNLETGLALARRVKDTSREAKLLTELGALYSAQDQPETATVFLKQAVNLWEEIRAGLQVLPKNNQESFTETVADTYRQLADVLLTQGRIPEAQRVLDLLKIEEIREFTSQTRASWTSDGISLTAVEQEVQQAHGSLIGLAQAINNCELDGCSAERIRSLIDQQGALINEYEQKTQAAKDVYQRCSPTTNDPDSLCVNPENLGNKAVKLLDVHEDAVLVYPLVVEDKLWLLWAAKNNVAGAIEVNTVTPKKLADAVADFRQNINLAEQGYGGGESFQELQGQSQQLYDWVIKPLEAELTANQIKHLIFAHDRYTRYIPMAALHDGEHYLIEKYAVSSILAATETNTEEPPSQSDINVLGMGMSNPVDQFGALVNVPVELDGIVKESDSDTNGFYPGSIYLNQAFNEELLFSQLGSYGVWHIATHGKFEPGNPEESFLLLGDEKKFPIPKIDDLQFLLSKVHLVVLSACETAYGEEGSDGREIAGISSYFLKGNRADAVMASLWNVNDASTSLLMQRFYEFLATGELTKAEALQQAQLSLLYDENVETRMDAVRASLVATSAESGQPLVSNTPIAHPYHWSAFTIIGNAL